MGANILFNFLIFTRHTPGRVLPNFKIEEISIYTPNIVILEEK